MFVTIIGRGHSGTRIPSKMLIDSGVYMGTVNNSSDYIPPDKMYEAVQYINSRVLYNGNYEWNFSKLKGNPPNIFKNLINSYLKHINEKKGYEYKGWKLPETTFTYPWIVKMFPKMKYIVWSRHPFDAILSPHKSDNLEHWNVPFNKIGPTHHRRAISWLYQYKLIKFVQKPKNVIHVKYEDFVTNPKQEVERLEEFLGIPLKIPEVFTTSVEKWRNVDFKYKYDFLIEPAKDLGYET